MSFFHTFCFLKQLEKHSFLRFQQKKRILMGNHGNSKMLKKKEWEFDGKPKMEEKREMGKQWECEESQSF